MLNQMVHYAVYYPLLFFFLFRQPNLPCIGLLAWLMSLVPQYALNWTQTPLVSWNLDIQILTFIGLSLSFKM